MSFSPQLAAGTLLTTEAPAGSGRIGTVTGGSAASDPRELTLADFPVPLAVGDLRELLKSAVG